MRSARVLSVGMAIGFLLAVLGAIPPRAHAAWVNGTGTQFQVGGALTTIVPTATGTPFADPTCGFEGGTSLALVHGSKLAGVDPVLYPVVLVVSCLDSGEPCHPGAAELHQPGRREGGQAALDDGSCRATAGPTLSHRQDKGDLLGCGSNGALYSIDYSQTTTHRRWHGDAADVASGSHQL